MSQSFFKSRFLKHIGIGVGLFCILLLTNQAIAKYANGRHLPRVVSFHEIEPQASNPYAVSLSTFISFLDWLEAEGYITLLPNEYAEMYEKKRPVPKKAIMISFDDGYPGNYYYAVPELRKRGMKATFFVHTAYVSDGRHMTWEQLQELQEDDDFEVGSHTVTHKALTKISSQEAKLELTDSYLEILDKTGKCDSFAYPNGAYDARVLKIMQKLPYKYAFMYRSDFNRLIHQYRNYGYNELFSIPRIGVEKKTSLADFKYYVTH